MSFLKIYPSHFYYLDTYYQFWNLLYKSVLAKETYIPGTFIIIIVITSNLFAIRNTYYTFLSVLTNILLITIWYRTYKKIKIKCTMGKFWNDDFKIYLMHEDDRSRHTYYHILYKLCLVIWWCYLRIQMIYVTSRNIIILWNFDRISTRAGCACINFLFLLDLWNQYINTRPYELERIGTWRIFIVGNCGLEIIPVSTPLFIYPLASQISASVKKLNVIRSLSIIYFILYILNYHIWRI